ncbi:MAG: DNA repair protein RecO [Rickettsiaceae bacterium]
MEFQDIGIIISKQPLKDHYDIIQTLTKTHGLYSGVVRRSRKKPFQVGDLVDFFWRARLHEHIGMAKCELIKSYSSYILFDKTKIYALNAILNMINIAFHERAPHNNFFLAFIDYLDFLAVEEFSLYRYIKLELEILSESGYALSLDKCSITGNTDNIKYVSPKSGNAISYELGKLYSNKLLILPGFLIDPDASFTKEDITYSFMLTDYFFKRYFQKKYKLNTYRDLLLKKLLF